MDRLKFITLINQLKHWTDGGHPGETVMLTDYDEGRRIDHINEHQTSVDFVPVYEALTIGTTKRDYHQIRFDSIDVSDIEVMTFLIDEEAYSGNNPLANRTSKVSVDPNPILAGPIVRRVFLLFGEVTTLNVTKVIQAP
jgi:hypothetical protein